MLDDELRWWGWWRIFLWWWSRVVDWTIDIGWWRIVKWRKKWEEKEEETQEVLVFSQSFGCDKENSGNSDCEIEPNKEHTLWIMGIEFGLKIEVWRKLKKNMWLLSIDYKVWGWIRKI